MKVFSGKEIVCVFLLVALATSSISARNIKKGKPQKNEPKKKTPVVKDAHPKHKDHKGRKENSKTRLKQKMRADGEYLIIHRCSGDFPLLLSHGID